MVLALPVKNHCCRFTADGARRAGSNKSSAPLMSVISPSGFLLNSETLSLCNLSFGLPKANKMTNSSFDLFNISFVGFGPPYQQLPIPFTEKNKSICCSIKPAFVRYPSLVSENTAR